MNLDLILWGMWLGGFMMGFGIGLGLGLGLGLHKKEKK